MHRINKVKFDGAKVRLEFEIERPDGRFDESVVASFDAPLPSFNGALQALAADVCTICESGADQAAHLRVSSVSFSHANDIMGAVITGVKPVMTAQSPVVLNTPHLTVKPYGDVGPVFSLGTVERLERLITEAERYILGERAQQALPLDAAAGAPATAGATA